MVAQFKQYPNSITVTVVTPATQDAATRLWTPGTETTHQFDCRCEMNRQGRRVATGDGSFEAYDYDILMPCTDVTIPKGSKFILDSGETGAVKRQWRGQLSSRLWV
jgi:hypothetical protein